MEGILEIVNFYFHFGGGGGVYFVNCGYSGSVLVFSDLFVCMLLELLSIWHMFLTPQ
jgi:hypothetical protein